MDTLGSAADEESVPRPWHTRTFADATVQRLSVALQRGVQEDQLLLVLLYPSQVSRRYVRGWKLPPRPRVNNVAHRDHLVLGERG